MSGLSLLHNSRLGGSWFCVVCCNVEVEYCAMISDACVHVAHGVWFWNVPRSIHGQWVVGLRGLPADT